MLLRNNGTNGTKISCRQATDIKSAWSALTGRNPTNPTKNPHELLVHKKDFITLRLKMLAPHAGAGTVVHPSCCETADSFTTLSFEEKLYPIYTLTLFIN